MEGAECTARSEQCGAVGPGVDVGGESAMADFEGPR